MLDLEAVSRSVRRALEEDLGTGDVTSRAVVPEGARAAGRFVAREPLVVAGLPVAREVFRRVDAGLAFETPLDDGAACAAGSVLATVRGAARPILEGERTALNFLQRLSGIATVTRALVDRVRGTPLQVADTRKTAPGLRVLDKYAVAVGGGTNHRAGLFDAWLIKDNHWRLAGGVGPALQRARAALGGRPAPGIGLEIEVGTLDEVREALAGGADALLLDNMDEATLQRAVETARGRAFLEVSGNVPPERLETLARLGVDRVSFGSLTHSVRAVDIALEVEGA
jgi:nicotinate-nucleotide pyrophosphorylase (carboxylating)